MKALGHDVGLIPAAYVKPFVRRNKTDARDAAAICVAAGHPDIRSVPVKSEARPRGLWSGHASCSSNSARSS